MTEREAIHKLIQFRRILEKGVFPVGYRFDAEPFDIAVEVLGKQVPMKPVWKEIDITNDGVPCKNAFCPVCEAEYEPDDIDRIGFDYCYSCGQAIDWGEE